MSLEMSRFETFERGFCFKFIPEGKQVITKLIHPDFPELDIQVWNVSSERNELKPGYIQTVLSIYKLSVGIHIQSLVNHYRSVRRLGIDVIAPNEAIARKMQQSKKLNWAQFCQESDLIRDEVQLMTELGGRPRWIANVVKRMRPTGERRIERLREEVEKNLEDHFLQSAGEACYQNELERFIEKHLPLLPIERYANWKRHLSWIMNGEDDRDKVFEVLTYLYKRVPKWIKACSAPNHHTVYIRARRKIPFSFECRRDGTLLMQYSYQPPESVQMQCLEIDLDTGKSVQWIGFQPHLGEKILHFNPFEERIGLIHYLDFFDRGEFLKIGKHEVYDTNLWDYYLKRQTVLTRIARLRWKLLSSQVKTKNRSIGKRIVLQKKIVELTTELKKFEYTDQQKRQIAFQLLTGLLILHGERYVHFGITPPAILLQSNEKEKMEAKISNYEYLYSYDALPKRDLFTYKWQTYFPKIRSNFQKEIHSPASIAIFQLGHCFRLLYGNLPDFCIENLIDGMTESDVEQRLTANLALTQLLPNHSYDPRQEIYRRKNEFELRSVTTFSVPPLTEGFVEGDERKE